jgi:Spy/CpxP family protein refolding chaperone
MRAFALAIGAAAAMLPAAPGLAAEKPGYAGQQSRQIKALSEEDVAALRNGDGMGFAKAAELNSYPGPRHALDLARELKLSDAQTRQISAVYERMRGAARSLGAALIEREGALDRLFATAEITPDRLAAETSAIGDIQARLRAVHLLAHLETRAVLGAEQVARYNGLRGYDKPSVSSAPHSGAHRH